MFHINIFEAANKNSYFREVLCTNDHSQLVIMNLLPHEEIGMEVHKVDQIIMITQGEGEAVVDDERFGIEEADIICIPARSHHNIINTSNGDMKLFTIYAPAQHKDGTINKTKADADKKE